MTEFDTIIADLLIVLSAGFVAGAFCKRHGISLLVGYLVVGGIIGQGVLGFVDQQNHELEMLAHVGALLLLFSVGLEFSLDELMRLSRYFVVGGIVQMLAVAIPLTAVCLMLRFSLGAAVLTGFAGALSSTVLVFKALAEWGQSGTMHGKRAIGILLFQDVALVPLMLLVPLLTQAGDAPTAKVYAMLAIKSLIFVGCVFGVRWLVGRWGVGTLQSLRSVELLVLFSIVMLAGVSWAAYKLGLPSAVGALAAGIVLSGNRLSHQIDTVVLPFRESFAVIFFVTIGSLLNPEVFIESPLPLIAGLAAILALKTTAAATALRLIGLKWKAAFGMGMGLAQLGEFSFLLISGAVAEGLLTLETYNRMLLIGLGSLILTPQLIKVGLRWTDGRIEDEFAESGELNQPQRHAMVIGLGPIGRQVASRLETLGVDVCLLDLSPINLHPFSQAGFTTVAGDARDPAVLSRANVAECEFAMVSVPIDEIAVQIVSAVRAANPQTSIIVRCRYQGMIPRLKKAGADRVVSEEAEASKTLMVWCDRLLGDNEQ